MAVKGEWVRYGEGCGYFATPGKTANPLPGVLVIQEVGGVNEHIEDVTRRIAAAGYAALAPDLYAVSGTRPQALTKDRIAEAFRFAGNLPPGTMFDPARREAELAKLPPSEAARIGETFGQVFSFVAPGKAQTLVAPLQRAFRHLREERAECRDQKIGCVGFCMGGGLSALLACEEPELAGAAVFYGTTPPAEKVASIACPVIAFYGALDQRVNAGIPGFQEAMSRAGKSFTHHVYEGAGHAFFNDDSTAYNVKAARDAFHRLLAFFSQTLAV
jgi:carboxymethylenebutenolidase